MKTKIIIAIYLIANCAGLIFFLIKGGQVESSKPIATERAIAVCRNIIKDSDALKNSPSVIMPDLHLFKSTVELLSDSAKLNLATIRTYQKLAFWSIVLSALNSLLFAVYLLRTRQVKRQ